MNTFLKKFAFAVGVLIITTAIFVLVTEDHELKEEVFNRSLKLLGEQLLAMVPDDSNAQSVADSWQDFSAKALKGEVPQEKVREIAVSIMNASNADEAWTSEDAKVILNLAMPEPADAATPEPLNEFRIFDEAGIGMVSVPKSPVIQDESNIVIVNSPPPPPHACCFT